MKKVFLGFLLMALTNYIFAGNVSPLISDDGEFVGIGTVNKGTLLTLSANEQSDQTALSMGYANRYGIGFNGDGPGHFNIFAHQTAYSIGIGFDLGSYGTFEEAITIRRGKNVGIGVLEPSQKLDVDGIIRARKGLQIHSSGNQSIRFTVNTNEPSITHIYNYDEVTSSHKNIAINAYGGNLGIGTGSPGTILTLSETETGNRTAVSMGYANRYGIGFNGDGPGHFNIFAHQTAHSIGIGFDSGSYGTFEEVITVRRGKSVGIGIQDPLSKLDVDGIVRARKGLQVHSSGNQSNRFTINTNNPSITHIYNYDEATSTHRDIAINAYGGKISIGGEPTSEDFGLTVHNGIYATQIRVRETVTARDINTDNINTASLKVKTDPEQVADYVFEKDYKLMPLAQLEEQIKANKHLPGVPSRDEVEEVGSVDVADFQMKLLEKIEELTLYTIKLNKIVQEQQKELSLLKTSSVRIEE